MSSKPVSLNLDLETIALLDEAGRREGRSRSAMANRLIVAALTPPADLGGFIPDLTPYGAEVRGRPARGTDLSGFKPDPKP